MSRKRTTDQTPPEPTAAVANPPATESQTDAQSFAERVGQPKRIPDPDPFPLITDAAAGVRLLRSNRDRQFAIMFGDGSPKDKPPQPILDKMHEAGWEWKSALRVWALPFTPDSAIRRQMEAERLCETVATLLRQEKGIEPGPGMPF